ncbi:MAG TPA: filamentous hemagglutinin N-terminal domain-containing protein [Ramlibacter sp.]|nr:filamentous hemagglutinin N-terminal domain-containing protein [Ramlibacter sp.]
MSSSTRIDTRVSAPSRAALIAAVIAAIWPLAAASAPVFVFPVGPQAVHGTANAQIAGNLMTVTTQNGAGTAHSVVNWQSFSLSAAATTQFVQPSAASTAINRVVGSGGGIAQSFIDGTLSSNGRLVLVNPAGIAFGAGSVVDTAGFVASTLSMAEADAISGRWVFSNAGSAGALSADGAIVARSGDVILMAPSLEVGANALIQAPNGATLLAAGQAVGLTGPGLEGIVLMAQARNGTAVNLGRLEGDAVGIFAGTLRHSGDIQVDAVTQAGGRVALVAKTLEVEGTVAARGPAGGAVTLLTDALTLTGGVDAGAGRIAVAPMTPTTAIEIGGSGAATDGVLTLRQADVDRLHAGTIAVGSLAASGGISFAGPLAVTTASSLSLLQGATGVITSAAGPSAPPHAVVVARLNAVAGAVSLEGDNRVQTVSGRALDAAGAGFAFRSGIAGPVTVGAVDGVAGIRSAAAVTLRAPAGGLVQTEAIVAPRLLTASLGGQQLTNTGNGFAAIDATSAGGGIAVVNGNPGETRLRATAGGAVLYGSPGAVAIDRIVSNSSNSGGTATTAAVGVQAASISSAAGGSGIRAGGGGSVALQTTAGAIGSAVAPLRISGASGLWAQAQGSGGDVFLATPDAQLTVQALGATGQARLDAIGAPGGVLDLRNAAVAGALEWTGFAASVLGAGGGIVAARGPMTASGNVELAGTLSPGGPVGLSTLTVPGDLLVRPGAILRFEFGGQLHDTIRVGGTTRFPEAGTSSVVVNAAFRAPPGDYALIEGPVTGGLPLLTSSFTGITLGFGSLMANVLLPAELGAATTAVLAYEQRFGQLRTRLLGEPSSEPAITVELR